MPRYRSQYKDTLRLYAAEFGQAAPRRIWPQVKQARTSAHRLLQITIGCALVAILAVLLIGQGILPDGFMVLIIFAGIAAVVFSWIAEHNRQDDRKRKSDGGGGDSGGCGAGCGGCGGCGG